MLPDLLGLLTVAVVIAVPFVSRRLRAPARARAAGTAAIPPVRPEAAAGMAAPPVTVHPRATEPFAGDGILIRGEAS